MKLAALPITLLVVLLVLHGTVFEVNAGGRGLKSSPTTYSEYEIGRMKEVVRPRERKNRSINRAPPSPVRNHSPIGGIP